MLEPHSCNAFTEQLLKKRFNLLLEMSKNLESEVKGEAKLDALVNSVGRKRKQQQAEITEEVTAASCLCAGWRLGLLAPPCFWAHAAVVLAAAELAERWICLCAECRDGTASRDV